MKKSLLMLVAVLATVITFGQDKLYKHTGEKLDVKIIKVGEFSISFSYPNETAEQTIGKYAVAKVEYASGRKEDVTEKIVISSKEDWEKVIILEDVSATVGLKRQGEIRGKTSGLLAVHTAGSADKKALKKLKMEAAELGCPFILMQSEKNNQYTQQAMKNGFAYTYK